MKNSENMRKWRRAIESTEVLNMPKHSIATFGPTNLNYYYLSALGESSTRVRSGLVSAEKPNIILPGRMQELYQGFAPEAREMAEEFFQRFGNQLKALGYKFKHESQQIKTSEKSFKDTYKKIHDEVTDRNLTGIIRGPDAYWEIAVLKFTVEMAAKSFQANVTELDEHGLFDPDGQLKAQLERLFYQADRSPETVPVLAEFLKINKIFEEYEDRFFDLVQRKRHSMPS